jgi:hypothetical protein
MKLRRIIFEIASKIINYDSFLDFINSEYGKNPNNGEVSEAIIEWADRFEKGLNDGDFKSVSEYMSNDIYDIIDGRISGDYMNKMRFFVKKERKEL